MCKNNNKNFLQNIFVINANLVKESFFVKSCKKYI